jgi:hypothetical protein
MPVVLSCMRVTPPVSLVLEALAFTHPLLLGLLRLIWAAAGRGLSSR